jgi:hypothetical protein
MDVARPIQIVPLRDLALAAPTSTPRLTYRGGPLLPAVQVFTLFWGVAWEQGPLAALVQQINQFFDFAHESLVRFCEVNFGLRSLNARTAASDAMEDCFDFTQSPLPPPR